MKDICICIICVCATVFSFLYICKIRKRKAVATTATWIIFVIGCTLSLVTYFIAQKGDWRSGIMNTVDIVYVSVILAAIFLWTDHKIRFKPFEKWYLAGAGLIVAYGVVTGDAWKSNVLTQVLMSSAYLPMFHKLFVEKKKTDSYLAWIPPAFTAAVALYPAIYEGNALAILYASRALFFTLVTVSIMLYYDVKSRRAASVS